MHCHPGDACEVEFTNEAGEMLDFLALRQEQFIVVWQARKKKWVPIAERIASLTARLPKEAGEEVLDFARFLHARRQRILAGSELSSGMGVN